MAAPSTFQFDPVPRCVGRWAPGDLVDRLLDDVSDIWVGAVVRCAYPGELYDIVYTDGSDVESGVEGCELRERPEQFSVPGHVWVLLGDFALDPQTLCAIESLARWHRNTAAVASSSWWCSAFHHRLGRCGDGCPLAQGASASSAAILCNQLPISESPIAPPSKSWKERYSLKSGRRKVDTALGAPTRETDEVYDKVHGRGEASSTPQGPALDGRIRFGAQCTREQAYDPRYGCEVPYDG
eukprot:TRINITY_DN9037_c1_g3_i1.p1 TRINITY_DN9037_c1_g3~~TRINITY_DN9037_c1_g3_i1.p1  ORF type:complete len:240 (+),score=16.79 TRINITY_DN9037_c1_g3_i1:39-758(+)